MLQMLKESFGISEDAPLVGHQSFEKGNKKMVQKSRAWAVDLELTKKI